MSIIETKNLTKSYDYYRKKSGFLGSLKSFFKRDKQSIEAVKNLNISIKKGELVGFLGPNGAGKTTVLKMLSGILYSTSGEARVLGSVPWKRNREYQKQFSIVMGQKNQLWWDLPPMESFVLNKEIYEVPEEDFQEKLEELTSMLEIKDILDVQVRKLSLGQRMKCELVAALIHEPKVLFLDEPTIGLDVFAQKKIRDFIRKYNRKKKTTIILTSHYMDDIKELCKRVLIIDKGVLIYDGDLERLVDKHTPYKIIKIFPQKDKIKKKDLTGLGEITVFSSSLIELRVPRTKAKETAAQILTSNLPVRDIEITELEIEEVIRTIFQKK